MNCEAFKDQLVELAMGTLDASQRAEVLAHLKSGCAECNSFLAETREAVAALPLGLEPIDPPAAARDRLMSRVNREPSAASNPMRIGPAPAASPRRFSLFQALAGGAIAAGIMGAIFWNTSENQRQSIASLQAQLDENKKSLDQFQKNMQTKTDLLALNLQHANETILRTSETVEMMRSPGIQMVSLQGTEVQPRAKARAYYDNEKSTVHFYATDVPQARAGKAYELWLITAKGASKAGMFEADQASQGIAIAFPSTADKIVKFAVTEEPAAGSPQPTSPIMLIGDVQ